MLTGIVAMLVAETLRQQLRHWSVYPVPYPGRVRGIPIIKHTTQAPQAYYEQWLQDDHLKLAADFEQAHKLARAVDPAIEAIIWCAYPRRLPRLFCLKLVDHGYLRWKLMVANGTIVPDWDRSYGEVYEAVPIFRCTYPKSTKENIIVHTDQFKLDNNDELELSVALMVQMLGLTLNGDKLVRRQFRRYEGNLYLDLERPRHWERAIYIPSR